MTGYWKDSDDNPFNQMDYTRGGGGYDNDQTHESNDRRAFAMSGVDALPRFASPGVGAAVVDRGAQFVSGSFVYQNGKVPTSGPGNATAGTAAPGNGGTGPGVAQAATGRSGGSGSGSRFVIGGTDGVWWEKAGSASAVPGSFVRTSALPALQPVLKGDNTALVIGGEAFVPDPGTSDAEEIEALLGDGDNPTEIAWWFKQAAGIQHIEHNVNRWANDPATKQWAREVDEGFLSFVNPFD